MKPRARFSRVLRIALVTSLSGCGERTAPDPDDSSSLGLAIAVRTDSLTFQDTGEFDLELIPSSSSGQSLVSEHWASSIQVTAPAAISPRFVHQALQPPDTSSPSVALLIDNSRSMSRNDPDRLRYAAAKLFWETVLRERPTAQVALLYFGLNGPPTNGFLATGLLRFWSSDPSELAGALDTLAGGEGSRIYTSALEATAWIDSTASVTRRRTILLLTDGQPTRESEVSSADVIAAAQRAGVRIGAVGLGPASENGIGSDLVAVALLQELANGTGGLYAGSATPEALTPTLLSLTAQGSAGMLRARYKLSPIPAKGTPVSGTVALSHQTWGTARGRWSFTAP